MESCPVAWGCPEPNSTSRPTPNLHHTNPIKEWLGTEEELRELADVEELAVCEYREEVFKILGRPGIGQYTARSHWWEPRLSICVSPIHAVALLVAALVGVCGILMVI